MVATPWGQSDSLRERMLRPGPGTPAEQVAENQRQRLFGAMVASVAERGYAATRVADLSLISGVSSRSFYELFPDKQACLLATLGALLDATEPKRPRGDEVDREAQAHRHFDSLTAAITAQPAAAKLCLIDALAAGPEASRLLDGAVERVEASAREVLTDPAEAAEMPDRVVSALVGAVVELTRGRLLRGEEDSLPSMGDGLVGLLLSYRPPTRPLRIGGRPPAVKPEAPEARDHAERGLRAFEALVAEQGYVETTMEQVAKRAAMSAKTLYANFDGKQELLLAAIDSAGAQIVAAVMPAFRRNAGWPEGVRAGLGALLGLLASRPAMARLAMVELFAGGPAALRRRTEALRPLQALLAGGRHYSPQAPAIAPEAILAGIVALCRKAIDGSGPESLPSLLPVATYVALAPFLGAEEATATAIGEAGRGERRELALTQASDRMRVILSQRTATPQEIAAEIGIPVDEVLAQLEHLFKVGLVQQVDERTTGQGIEPVYAGANQKLGTERWSEISLEERQRISAEIRRGIAGDVERAVESGSFDARVDRYLARVPFWVDEEGWREIGDVLEVALANCLEIQTRSNARLSGATTGGFSARAVFALFEVPEAGDQEGPARPD